MKLTSKAFSKWYITKSHQGIKFFEEGAKNDGTRVNSIGEAANRIIEHRIIDEATDPMDINDYMQLELKVREEVQKAIDPTGEMVRQYRERAAQMMPEPAMEGRD